MCNDVDGKTEPTSLITRMWVRNLPSCESGLCLSKEAPSRHLDETEWMPIGLFTFNESYITNFFMKNTSFEHVLLDELLHV